MLNSEGRIRRRVPLRIFKRSNDVADMQEIEAARRHWAFYRDRRPEVYTGIATP